MFSSQQSCVVHTPLQRFLHVKTWWLIWCQKCEINEYPFTFCIDYHDFSLESLWSCDSLQSSSSLQPRPSYQILRRQCFIFEISVYLGLCTYMCTAALWNSFLFCVFYLSPVSSSSNTIILPRGKRENRRERASNKTKKEEENTEVRMRGMWRRWRARVQLLTSTGPGEKCQSSGIQGDINSPGVNFWLNQFTI